MSEALTNTLPIPQRPSRMPWNRRPPKSSCHWRPGAYRFAGQIYYRDFDPEITIILGKIAIKSRNSSGYIAKTGNGNLTHEVTTIEFTPTRHDYSQSNFKEGYRHDGAEDQRYYPAYG